jgi:hypothetical protein
LNGPLQQSTEIETHEHQRRIPNSAQSQFGNEIKSIVSVQTGHAQKYRFLRQLKNKPTNTPSFEKTQRENNHLNSFPYGRRNPDIPHSHHQHHLHRPDLDDDTNDLGHLHGLGFFRTEP